MPRKFNNKRKCKGLCKREYVDGIRVFPQKKLPYKKASWCSECEVSVLPPSVDKIRWGIGGRLEEEIEKIKVICPCCKNICRGGPHGKSKPKPRVQYPEKPGRPEGPDKVKEEVDYWAKIINERKDSVFGETLEDVPLYLQSKVKKRSEKYNETKTSHVT